jgi:Tol biopolymer transport system component
MDIDPLWLPDGSGIIFASNRTGRFNMFRKPLSGTGVEELLMQSDVNQYPLDVSPDGRCLVYTQVGKSTGDDLWVYPLAQRGKPYLFAGSEFAERLGVFSPDGRFMAYISDESGRFEVYVRPFPPSDNGAKRIVSIGGGTQPRWDPNGKELYFIAPDGMLMEVAVDLSSGFRAEKPKPLFQTGIWSAAGVTNGHRWDIARDGRFLINTATPPVNETITVVLNGLANATQ